MPSPSNLDSMVTPSDLVIDTFFDISAKIRTPLEVQGSPSSSSSSFSPSPFPSPPLTCLLSTVYCLLSTVYCLLYTVDCILSTAKYSQGKPSLRSEVYWLCRIQLNQIKRKVWMDRRKDGHTDGQTDIHKL